MCTELESILSFLFQCLSHFSHIHLSSEKFSDRTASKHNVYLDGWCALFMCLFPALLSYSWGTHHCSCTFALSWLRGNGFIEKTCSLCLLWIYPMFSLQQIISTDVQQDKTKIYINCANWQTKEEKSTKIPKMNIYPNPFSKPIQYTGITQMYSFTKLFLS